jgi:hypothetical protein
MLTRCLRIESEKYDSYKLSRVSGNPRISPPSELTLIVEIDGKEMAISIIKQLRKVLLRETNKTRTAREGSLKIYQMTNSRIAVAQQTMPPEIMIEINPEYAKNINDLISTPYRVVESDIEIWANRMLSILAK